MLDRAFTLQCPAKPAAAPSLPAGPCSLAPVTVGSFTGGSWVHPSIDEWSAGDIVLTRREPPDLGTSAVEFIQSLLLPKECAEFAHVGLYDGAGHIYEAHPSLLSSGNFRTKVTDWVNSGSLVHVRRIQGFITNEAAIAAAAHQQGPPRYRSLQATYAKDIMRRIFWRRTGGAPVANPSATTIQSVPGELMCAMYVRALLSMIMGQTFMDDLPIVLPGDFGDRPDIDCVTTIQWRRY